MLTTPPIITLIRPSPPPANDTIMVPPTLLSRAVYTRACTFRRHTKYAFGARFRMAQVVFGANRTEVRMKMIGLRDPDAENNRSALQNVILRHSAIGPVFGLSSRGLPEPASRLSSLSKRECRLDSNESGTLACGNDSGSRLSYRCESLLFGALDRRAICRSSRAPLRIYTYVGARKTLKNTSQF